MHYMEPNGTISTNLRKGVLEYCVLAMIGETSWRESSQGAPRRYYTLTAAGRESLAAFTGVWNDFQQSVSNILNSATGDPR